MIFDPNIFDSNIFDTGATNNGNWWTPIQEAKNWITRRASGDWTASQHPRPSWTNKALGSGNWS